MDNSTRRRFLEISGVAGTVGLPGWLSDKNNTISGVSAEIEESMKTDMKSDTDFYDGFEQGDLSKWKEIVLDDPRNKDVSNWEVIEDAITGSYSAHSNTVGDKNFIRTKDPVINSDSPFTVSFKWRTSSSDSRGISIYVSESETGREPDLWGKIRWEADGDERIDLKNESKEVSLEEKVQTHDSRLVVGEDTTKLEIGDASFSIPSPSMSGEKYLLFNSSGHYGSDSTITIDEVTAKTQSSPNHVFTFADGAEGWTFGMRNASRSTPGEGEWSERADGSLHLSVDGAPSTIQAWREVGPLSAGTTVSATYEPTRFEYGAAGLTLRLYVPSETRTIQLDKDSDNESGDYEQDGRLSGTVPEDLPAETQVELHLVIWPGDTEVWIDRVSVGAETNPIASFDPSPTDPTVGEQVSFDASSSSDPDGSIQSYEWDFDSDGSVDATGQVVNHTYEEAGEYTTTLSVVDADGRESTAQKPISVKPDEPPVATIERDRDSPMADQIIEFDASGSSDLDGSIQSYDWDFTGDGSTDATGVAVEHVYEEPGNYTVTLTVTDSQDSTTTETVSLSVDPATLPVAIDDNNNGVIDDEEIDQATQYWQNGTEVPGTDGKTISDSDLLELTRMWRNETEVDS